MVFSIGFVYRGMVSRRGYSKMPSTASSASSLTVSD